MRPGASSDRCSGRRTQREPGHARRWRYCDQARNVAEPARERLRIPKGKYVEISIQDSGVGIPEKYREKIFDPYFTTKEEGSLYIARSPKGLTNGSALI
jgi:signal transduction histidine kinase